MSEFKWDTSRFKSTKVMERKLQRALYGVCRYWDGPIERYMKTEAPWRDRTANARNGLFATAQRLGKTSFAILLGHSVTYGIYLELPHTHRREDGSEYTIGPYPIVRPTMEKYAPKVLKTLTKILNRLGGG